MLPPAQTPLVRLRNLFPERRVYAKCEFLGAGGSFKIRGATHLLESLRQAGPLPPLIVPSMGNTALGAAIGAKEFGTRMVGVVPTTLSKAKDEKLKALGVELVKVAGGGTDLLRTAKELTAQRGGYFVHPHLDARWTDGYQMIAAEIMRESPDCRSLVFPVGGGGLLMGLTEHFRKHSTAVRLYGVEAYNYPKYASFQHARSETIADGLKLETPHPSVQQRIAEDRIAMAMVRDDAIRLALKEMFQTQGLVIEPSSAITLAFVKDHAELPEPIAVVLTGQNIAPEDHARLMASAL